jgi:hypothetical protein
MRKGQEIYNNTMNSVKGVGETQAKTAFKALDEAVKQVLEGIILSLVETIQK